MFKKLIDKLCGIEIVEREEESTLDLPEINWDGLNKVQQHMEQVFRSIEISDKKEEDCTPDELAYRELEDELFDRFMTSEMSWEDEEELSELLMSMLI